MRFATVAALPRNSAPARAAVRHGRAAMQGAAGRRAAGPACAAAIVDAARTR